MYNQLINRLPSNYRKEKESNVGKLYQIISDELIEINNTIEYIKKYQDMDTAIGKTLDRIGNNVLELRNTEDDEVYRQFIKTKIIANLSQGDIETINEVAKVVLGDSFLGISETWNNSLYEDIAGIVLDIDPNGDYNFGKNNPLSRVKAGGVRMYFQAMLPSEDIILEESTFNFKARFNMTNETQMKDRLVNTNVDNLNILEEILKLRFTYQTASKKTLTKTSEANVESQYIKMNEDYFSVRVKYPITSKLLLCGGGK